MVTNLIQLIYIRVYIIYGIKLLKNYFDMAYLSQRHVLKAEKAFNCRKLTLPLRQILRAFHAKNKKYCDHRTR